METNHVIDDSRAVTLRAPRFPQSTVPLDVLKVGELLAKSGYFKEVRDMAQAVTKILAGQELGLGPIASLMGVFINTQGKIGYHANVIAAAIKRHPHYNFKVKQLDAQACVLVFFEDGVTVGESSFTLEDAKTAELVTAATKDNWKKYPRNMLFARALTNGQKWYAPDVAGGMALYTPEELGAAVTGEGEVIAPTPWRSETPNEQDRAAGLYQSTDFIEPSAPITPAKPDEAILKRSRWLFATFREGGFSESVLRDYMKARLNEESTKALTDAEARLLIDEVKNKTVQKWIELDSPALIDAPFLAYLAARFDRLDVTPKALNHEEFTTVLSEIEDGTVAQFRATLAGTEAALGREGEAPDEQLPKLAKVRPGFGGHTGGGKIDPRYEK